MGFIRGIIMWLFTVAAVVVGIYVYEELNSNHITLSVDGEGIKKEVQKFLPFYEDTAVEKTN